MKNFVKKLISEKLLKWLRPIYHGILAWDASIYYDRPSEHLIVIGITGTTGKSTTVALLAHILNSCGRKTGYITTVEFFDGKTVFVNKHGLSMPGEIKLQKQLKTMASRGCKYAIVECTSEGLAQNRHLGINFDVALFTNLSSAHLEAHGSFEKYQAAKGKLFLALQKAKKKVFFPQKIAGMNLDDKAADYFLQFRADKKFGISFFGHTLPQTQKNYQAVKKPGGFSLEGQDFEISLLGEFNLNNALLAAACANMLGVDLQTCAQALRNFHGIRGRMEVVPNNLGITVIVDYGCEPASFKAALLAVKNLPHQKIIHVFGSTGGHRDKAKQFEFGKISAQIADQIIITNDDVYDSDPEEIAKAIESGIVNYELWKGQYGIILDRRQAIHRALELARPNDIVLITGKGSEQFLVLPGNKRIQWDDVSVVQEELTKLSKNDKNEQN